MYYYEARYYKPPVFTSRDAMFEKYFWMSPYTYCANNPVKYVDPDGREIRIYYKEKTGIARLFERKKYEVYTPNKEYNGTNKFVSETIKALNYVSNGDEKGIIKKIAEDTRKVIKIKETKIGNDYYNPLANTIRYHYQSGLEVVDDDGTPTGDMQSPALGLLHELGHAFIDLYKSMIEKINLKRFDLQYDNKEERWVIENIETPAANILGEGTRSNHCGNPFKAKNSTSVEPE